jgi:hypothetical protein
MSHYCVMYTRCQGTSRQTRFRGDGFLENNPLRGDQRVMNKFFCGCGNKRCFLSVHLESKTVKLGLGHENDCAGERQQQL